MEPSATPLPAPPPPEKHTPVGPAAGAVIIILLLIAGGLYFWGAKINENMQAELPYIPTEDTSVPESSTITSDTSAGLPPQGSSDSVSSIEADAKAMDMTQLEAENTTELNNI